MSLLETCASIGILGAVVIFAAPSLMRARESYQLDVIARQVAGDMQWTRIKAISRSRDCRLRVSSDTSYVIECQDPAWQTDKDVTLPRGFHVAATAWPEFHKRGNAAPAGTITISDSRAKTKRVVVNITGRVRVD